MAYLNEEQIANIGFKSIGYNVLISDRVSFYGADRISIGNDVRIDDFCLISAGILGIDIGSHVHLAAGCYLFGMEKITLSDFSGLSSRVSIYSSSDDYMGHALTNPTIPEDYRNIESLPVFLGRHVIVGSGSIILPGSHLDDGVAIGALCLVNTYCESFGVYAGNPLRFVKERNKGLLVKEAHLNNKINCYK